MSKIKILLVDDHRLFRSGMRQLLSLFEDFVVVGEAGSGEEALAVLKSVVPDVILMDVDMPGDGGLLATTRIRAAFPSCRILLLSGYARYAVAGMQAGASGYVLKVAEDVEIAEAIHTVHQGGVYLQAGIQPVLIDVLQHGLAVQLSEREIAILRLVAMGASNQEIGEQLGLGERRVKQHISALLERLGANDRAHAVALAIRQGLL
jgi:DNA-binding NarL/FixJ family response regulator